MCLLEYRRIRQLSLTEMNTIFLNSYMVSKHDFFCCGERLAHRRPQTKFMKFKHTFALIKLRHRNAKYIFFNKTRKDGTSETEHAMFYYKD